MAEEKGSASAAAASMGPWPADPKEALLAIAGKAKVTPDASGSADFFSEAFAAQLDKAVT